MNIKTEERFTLPVGFLLSLILIGLLIVSAMLYYRAVRFQRFMEPLIAISRPKIQFSKSINFLLTKEFGSEDVQGIRLTSDSLIVEKTAFHIVDHYGKAVTMERIASLLLAVLQDPEVAPYIDLIVVIQKFSLSDNAAENRKVRFRMQQRIEFILSSLYKAIPELEKRYGRYFAPTAIPGYVPQDKESSVEFRFISTDRLHIDIAQEFGKYLH